jgi:hypothetical protein
MKYCPTCNRPFAPEIQFGGKYRQRLYDFVVKHPEGVTSIQIMDHLYADTPDGGSDSPKIVATMVFRINEILAHHSLRITGSGGPGSVYRLYPADSKEICGLRVRKRLRPEEIEAIAKDRRSNRLLEDIYGISDTSIWRIKQQARKSRASAPDPPRDGISRSA